jgi:hypothetical protein
MTAVNPSRLGARQIAVLRAAKAGKLIRFDSGTWDNGGHACTPAGRSVAARGLLEDGRRMVRNTLGSARAEHGCYVGLSSLGDVMVEAWERAHPEVLEAEARRAAGIKALAAKPGRLTAADVVALAAADETVPDDTYLELAESLHEYDEDQP